MSNSGALVYFDKFSKEQVKEINRKIKEMKENDTNTN